MNAVLEEILVCVCVSKPQAKRLRVHMKYLHQLQLIKEEFRATAESLLTTSSFIQTDTCDLVTQIRSDRCHPARIMRRRLCVSSEWYKLQSTNNLHQASLTSSKQGTMRSVHCVADDLPVCLYRPAVLLYRR